MWLSNIPIWLFGESNFSYRFLDALAGVITVLLCFFLGLELFSSTRAGVFSAILLLSCRSFLFEHMTRDAVQDSMLVLLCTLAMFAGWRIFSTLSKKPLHGSLSLYRPGILFGLCTGLAILTKSYAGFLPLFLLGFLLLVSGKISMAWKHARGAMLMSLAVSLVIPALYFVPHLLNSEIARDHIFSYNLSRRFFTVGFHNKDNPLYYFTQIFIRAKTLAPTLLLLSLLFALVKSIKGRQNYFYLLAWAALPVIVYSFLDSRLIWYIAPAFPAMALLCGGMLDALISNITGDKTAASASMPIRTCSVLVLLLAIYTPFTTIRYGGGIVMAIDNLRKSAERVIKKEKQLALDEAVSDILELTKNLPATQIVYYKFDHDIQKTRRLKWREKFYHHMLLPYARRVNEISELEGLLKPPGNKIFILPLKELASLPIGLRPSAYKAIPLIPRNRKERWHRPTLLAFSFDEQNSLSSFRTIPQKVDFSSSDLDILSGLTDSGKSNFRMLKGPRAGILLQGDPLLSKLGASFKINFAPDKILFKEGLLLRVYLNEVLLAEITPRGRDFGSYSFKAPASAWTEARNHFGLSCSTNSLDSIHPSKLCATLNWLVYSPDFDSLTSNPAPAGNS